MMYAIKWLSGIIATLSLVGCSEGFRSRESSADLSSLESTGLSAANLQLRAGGTAYKGHLGNVICDIKKPLAGQMPNSLITMDNYAAILNGLVAHLGCSGIRVYIDPAIARSKDYPAVYKAVLKYARTTLGLKIYANPLGTGSFGFSDAQFATWVAGYANFYRPEFLAPFNESGLRSADLESITNQVRGLLQYAPQAVVGPDAQKVSGSQALVDGDTNLINEFDIIGSHNAAGDELAIAAKWKALANSLDRELWATENPRLFSQANSAGQEIGVKAILNAPVTGLVLYLAVPCAVDLSGRLTAKGNDLMSGLLAIPRAVNPHPTATDASVCGM